MYLPQSRMSGVGLGRLSFKQLITYGDHLKVNQPNIDAQHEAIFDLAFEIEELWHNRGDLDQIKAVAEKLSKVLESHFHYEEQELSAIGYTKLEEHRGEHRVMLEELQIIRDRLGKMGHGPVRSEPGFLVLSYILGVTIGHISHSDMDYRTFSNEAVNAGGKAWKDG
jgi:hemerythrin